MGEGRRDMLKWGLQRWDRDSNRMRYASTAIEGKMKGQKKEVLMG